MESTNNESLDFQLIFESVPGCYLILAPNSPHFTILAVTDAYAQATKTIRQDIVGKGLFEIFPDNPSDAAADGVKNLTASLDRVIANKKFDHMAIQKYDIPKPEKQGGGFEVRYWDPVNSPVLDSNGNVVYIVHYVTDVTQYENILQTYGSGYDDAKDFSGQMTQIERITKLTVARELKMVELKEKISELEQKIKEQNTGK